MGGKKAFCAVDGEQNKTQRLFAFSAKSGFYFAWGISSATKKRSFFKLLFPYS
jgi:hypothetical protein